MDGNRFNQICSQLMLWEQLQVELQTKQPDVLAAVAAVDAPTVSLVGLDLPVLVDGFLSARALLRELVDAAKNDNEAPGNPLEIRPSNSAPATPGRTITIGEHISPCIPVAEHDRQIAELQRRLRGECDARAELIIRGADRREDASSPIETLTEVCKAQAETIAALADSLVELSKN